MEAVAGICRNTPLEYTLIELKREKIMRNMRSINLLPKDAVYDEMESPVGKLTLIASSEGLHAVLWDCDLTCEYYQKIINSITKTSAEKTIIKTKSQLNEYFAGKLKIFDIPLAAKGTDFQISAWQVLKNIPYATTISYKEQAKSLGDINKARAVGMANGLNPISIIVPCHRVIGSNGLLVGFAGGMNRKEYLLQLEKNNLS
ncbi:MAG: ogt [Burkholderiales bacterium]|jgi:methylated-DNA-[protein]-cysteine S-methyltransferase|nr:ogt [Burkholderiales bacterium]